MSKTPPPRPFDSRALMEKSAQGAQPKLRDRSPRASGEVRPRSTQSAWSVTVLLQCSPEMMLPDKRPKSTLSDNTDLHSSIGIAQGVQTRDLLKAEVCGQTYSVRNKI